jgi:hypothetical protein
VTPDGSVKFSFSPLGSANPNDPTTQTITIGDGTLEPDCFMLLHIQRL